MGTQTHSGKSMQTHWCEHIHLRKDNTFPPLVNKSLGNNKNNFNVFTDESLWGFCTARALTASLHNNAASKSLIPEVEFFCLYVVCVHMPWGGYATCIGITRSWIPLVLPLSQWHLLVLLLLWCAVLFLQVLLSSFGCFRCTGRRLDTVWSVAYINPQPHSLNPCLVFK